jgi:REP element-mobilizing transposase RayT
MTRPLRIQFEGAFYHIISRGNGRMMIFLQDKDWMKFIDLMEQVIERFNWVCHAYCLMGNHYHLLIETPDANLVKGMKRLNQLYSQFFNWKYNRVGSVLQGRYKSWLLEKESKFLDNCRYIVNNPVATGLVEHPSQWPWSSFRLTCGIEKNPAFLQTDFLLGHFSSSRRKAQKLYEHFVLAGIGRESPLKEAKNQIFLGSDSFIVEAMKHIRSGDKLNDVPRVQKFADRSSLTDIFPMNKNLPRQQRNQHIRTAFEKYGYTQREIGEHLNLHPGYISKIILGMKKD